MKVYVLGGSNYDGTDIHGIYSTREKTVSALSYSSYYDERDIQEIELDPENSGEKYEDYFFCNVKPSESKTQMWGGCIKLKPCEFVPFQFIDSLHDFADHTFGLGKTPEEAEANARHAQTLLHPVWIIRTDGYQKRLPHPSCVDGSAGRQACAVHEDFNVAKIAIMEYKATGKLSPFLKIPLKI